MDGSLWVRSRKLTALRQGAVQELLAELDQHEVGDDHCNQTSEQRSGERGEPERVRRCRECTSVPTATTSRVVTVSGLLGRLRNNRTRRVRIAKITRLRVASDSTNQPERKQGRVCVGDPDHDGEGGEVEDRADRPREDLNLRIIRMSQCGGFCSCSSSTLSVGIVTSPMS